MTIQNDPFRAAEARFRWLNHQRSSGQMDEATYRAELGQLRVQDARGNWWMMQEGTGAWFVWQGNQWAPAQPYPPAPAASPPPPPQPQYAGASGYQAPAAQALPPAPSVGGQLAKLTIAIIIIFGLIGAALAIFVKDFEPVMLLGVAFAAVISWMFTLRTLTDAWEGAIVELRMIRERSGSDDDDDWENVLYAFIRQPNGKIKKQRADPKWNVGDLLQKRKGETHIRKLN
jgi:hypothetical protein